MPARRGGDGAPTADAGGDRRRRARRAAAVPPAAPARASSRWCWRHAAATTSSSGCGPGVLEQGTVDTAASRPALGERLRPRGAAARRHRAALRRRPATASTSTSLTGSGHHRLRPAGGRQGPHRRPAGGGRRLRFEVEDVAVHDLDTDRPRRLHLTDGGEQTLECDVDRRLRRVPRRLPADRPAGVLTVVRARLSRSPGWASWPRPRRRRTSSSMPSHERGFALHSMRSPDDHPALPAGAAGRGHRRLARRPHLGRAARPAWPTATASR